MAGRVATDATNLAIVPQSARFPPRILTLRPPQPASAHNSTAPVYAGYGATQYPVPMPHDGRWTQETPYGSGGYTAAGASPPQPSLSPSPVLMNNGRCAPRFDPHLLTAHIAQQGKAASASVLGSGFGGEEWVADSGANFHVTGNPSNGRMLSTPPPGENSLVVAA